MCTLVDDGKLSDARALLPTLVMSVRLTKMIQLDRSDVCVNTISLNQLFGSNKQRGTMSNLLLDDDEVNEPKPPKKPRLESKLKGDGIQKIQALAFRKAFDAVPAAASFIEDPQQTACPFAPCSVPDEAAKLEVAQADIGHREGKLVEHTEPLPEKKKLVQSTLTSFFKQKK